jgi:hypothetical protein
MAAWQCYVFFSAAAVCWLADRPRSFIDLIHSCTSLFIAVTSNIAVNIEINIMLATKASAAAVDMTVCWGGGGRSQHCVTALEMSLDHC